MKKRLFIILIFFVLLLTACSELAKSGPQVEKMLTALAQYDEEAAIELLDPKTFDNEELFSLQFSLMCDDLNGRVWKDYSYTSVSVTITNGNRTEKATMKVRFTDGSTMMLDYVTFNGKFQNFVLK